MAARSTPMSIPTHELHPLLEEYLTIRRAAGFELHNAGRLLAQFVDHLQDSGEVFSVEAALGWATLPACGSTHWLAMRLSAVRLFSVWLHATDPTVPVVPAGLIPRVGSDRARPYLYSQEDIGGLIDAAGALKPALRAATYQTLIGLLATTGMRISEAIGADDDDLDVHHHQLVVRNTKFGKSRLLPLHATTMQALTSYRRLRTSELPEPTSRALLVSIRGTRLLHSNISLTFTRLVEQVGLTPTSGACSVRIHDLRHSFAVSSLLDAYRDHADVPVLLARLATYLGHTDPKHTYWYLSAAPELMALAADRLDTHLGEQS
jgi:integrase/recombinase XerD